MTVAAFIAKWRKVDLKERSAAQEHFLDLCELVGHPKPAAADPTGADFCFEKGAAKHGGGDGFADAWKRLFFGWEYKGRHKDLDAAFDQLLLYKDSLDNPPLLVVCDMDRIVIRTNFTGTAPATHEIPLEKLGEPRNLEILHNVFFDPEKLKPGKTSEAITQDAADHFATIADSMRARGLDSGRVAHFLDRIVFCLFAEDIGLLPDMIFSRIVEKSAADPQRFAKLIGQLFDAMAHGGDFGMETIRHFNGNLFDDRSVLDLSADEVARITAAARLDWSAVDPSIFGTLFQRGLDPSMRAQLGAHFTGRADIEDVVDNVIMRPLRREWNETRTIIESLLTTGRKPNSPNPRPSAKSVATLSPAALRKARDESSSILHRFLARLQTIKVLDPACGSGNFLYVTLLKLKDLEKESILYAMDHDLGGFLPLVGPWQLYGIEINPYAFDLAQMTVWIGWLQWIRFNGFGQPQDPILRPMSGNFRCMDAIITLPAATGATEAPAKEAASPVEPAWPRVDFIVGNPPFLGDKMMRRELGDPYVDALRALYAGRIPGQSDLCGYWFEKARAHIAAGHCTRAGLLATQGIRGGANREVLKRIKDTGDIFWAQSDRPWILDGANVHVSMVGFSAKLDSPAYRETTAGSAASPALNEPILDGRPVPTINANLTDATDLPSTRQLVANKGICFLGIMKAGPFDVDETTAIEWLHTPNPNGRPSSDVLRPRVNAMNILRRTDGGWIIDFGCDSQTAEMAQYEAPFTHVTHKVKPERDQNRRKSLKDYWWLHGEPRPGLRRAITGLPRVILTPEVSKHRIFVWLDAVYLPDHQTRVFARSDDLFFGILHSHIHEVWALAQGTRLETRPRYTPTTCFETFPFPPGVLSPNQEDLRAPAPLRETSPNQEPRTKNQELFAAISAAAKDLDTLRQNWLNPPEWTREEILEFPGTVGGPWSRYILPAPALSAVEGSTPPALTTVEGSTKSVSSSSSVPTPDSALRIPNSDLGTVRYPRLVPRDSTCAASLAKRTLTALYNARPAWLADAHRRLDTAVFAAYTWTEDVNDQDILAKLLDLNHTQHP